MHCNAPGSRTGSFKRFTSRSKSFLRIYSRLSVQIIHVTWNLTTLCTRTTIRPYSVPDYSTQPKPAFISDLFSYYLSSSTRWQTRNTNLFISPDIRTVQLHNTSTRVVIFPILMDLSMQNLEFESVMWWRSLMRHKLAWWPKTAGCYPVSRTLLLVIRTLISLHRCVNADVIVRVVT
jgi:hypothetical protein